MPESATPPRLRVGNDVVDLAHPACQRRSSGDPLLARILTDRERAWLDAGSEVHWSVRLWALWAAKETAFKVGAKQTGASVFAPGTLECALAVEARRDRSGGKGAPTLDIGGTVRGPGLGGEVRVQGGSDGDYLHVVGWTAVEESLPGERLDAGVESETDGGPGEALESLRGRFTDSEWEGVHSLPSARVRLLARARLHAALSGGGTADGLPLADSAIEILTSRHRPGRTPPKVRVAGEDRPDLELSLSHHGRYLAWALLLPERT